MKINKNESNTIVLQENEKKNYTQKKKKLLLISNTTNDIKIKTIQKFNALFIFTKEENDICIL